MSINENKNKDDDNIKVILRIRPKNQNELKTLNNFYRIDHLNNVLYINTPTNKKYYNFDFIASEESNQTEIFMKSAKSICDYVLEGYNGTIFVYGQTGSGKTYTLLGPKYENSNLNLSKKNVNNNLYNVKTYNNNNNINNINILSKNNINNNSNNINNNTTSEDSNSLSINSERSNLYNNNTFNNNNINNFFLFNKHNNNNNNLNSKKNFPNDITKGIIPRVLEYLFKEKQTNQKSTLKFSCSFLEIYNENLIDLLNPKKNLSIITIDDKITIENLTKFSINSIEESFSLLKKGNKLRKIASTKMNENSSRSHIIFSIYISNTTYKKIEKNSVFHLIDLAGSERQKFSNTKGEQIKEAGKINKSLMNLSFIIQQLSDKIPIKKISFRDSKLTYLLKDSLKGKICIIINISPNYENYNETLSSLNFSQKAKKIKTKAILNEKNLDEKVDLEEIFKLHEKIEILNKEKIMLLNVLEKKNKKINNKINENFEKNCEFFEKEIEFIENENKNKENEINLLENEKNDLNEKLKIEILNNEIKKKETEKIKEEIFDIKNSIFELKEQTKKLEIENNKIFNFKNDFDIKINRKIIEKNEEINLLTLNIKNNQFEIEFLNNQISKFSDENKNLIKKFEDLNKKIENKNNKKNEIENKKNFLLKNIFIK